MTRFEKVVPNSAGAHSPDVPSVTSPVDGDVFRRYQAPGLLTSCCVGLQRIGTLIASAPRNDARTQSGRRRRRTACSIPQLLSAFTPG